MADVHLFPHLWFRMGPYNPEYARVGRRYEHIVRWEVHHGTRLDTCEYIIHHRDGNKRNNTTCETRDGQCEDFSCGNLAPMTRADHIREHRPGRMGGRQIPNKVPPRTYTCERCGSVKSRNGTLCRQCRYV